MSTLQSVQAFDQVIQGRFAGQQGWFILGFIKDDPDLEKMEHEWYMLPRQRAELAERCAELAARGFNLYWTACLFEQRKRSYAAALPSVWLWQDDAPADAACTELIQSSANSYQALRKLDRPISARERQRLQTAWRDATPGADSCSANAVQLGRMPGGYNRKRHGKFLVTVLRRTDQVWNADQLLAEAPTTAAKARGIITDLDWPAVEAHLTNIGALLSCGRSVLIRPDTQTGRILAGERLALSSARYARLDDSTSINACAAAYGFYLRGYMDDEIAAIIFHLYEQWGTLARKGTAWVRGDIHRILNYCHAKQPKVIQSPTRYTKTTPAEAISDVPGLSRARNDRPRRLDPAMLFARYQAEPALCELKRKERAARLQISTATLDRLEDSLETLGLIEIQSTPGMPGRVVLLEGVINIPEAEVLSAPDAARAPDRQNARSGCDESADRTPQCIGETHPPPEASAVASPFRLPQLRVLGSSADLVYEAIVAIDTQRPIDVLDRRTGELRTIKQRVTRQRVERYLQQTYPQLHWSPVELDQLYGEQLERRTRERKIAALGELTHAGLRAQIRLAEAMAEKSRARAAEQLGVRFRGQALEQCSAPLSNEYRWWEFYRDMAKRELASRPSDPARPKGGYRVCEALPDLRAAGGRRQAELWEIADDALLTLRTERRGRAASGVCSPKISTPAEEAPSAGWALIERLRARKEAA